MTATLTADSLAATFRADLAAHQKALDSLRNTLVSHGWIVVIRSPSLVEGRPDTLTATEFTVEGRKVTAPRFSSVLRCNRFTREDAEAIAPGVYNGAGSKGEAMHVTDALRHQIATLEDILATLAA